MATVDTDDVGMPLVVLAELLFGVEKSRRKAANLARLTPIRFAFSQAWRDVDHERRFAEDGAIDGLVVEYWLR
jgi:predicted nucleic acid-binding protein